MTDTGTPAARDDGPTGTPRLYGELSELWGFLSPPDSYVDEVASFRKRFLRNGVKDGARVLHMGSGGGSVDYHMKQHYTVTGVDISRAMLDYAARINPDVEYVHGDIRDVRLGRTFDAVLVHDAISYMTTVAELEAVYRSAAAHLEIGGVMIALPEELRHRVEPDVATVETRTEGDRTVTVIETDYDDDTSDNHYESVYVFLIREHGDLRVEVDRHVQGVFDLDDFLGAMDRAGFEASAEPWELPEWTPGRELPLVTAVRRR